MRRTPLAEAYAAEARGTIDLLGWSFPAAFSSAVEEHHAVRRRAGLFDFSFMAHFVVRGPDALAFVQRLVTRDAARLSVGAGMYSPICNERGTLVDDCTVIRRGRDEYVITTGLDGTFGWLADLRDGHDISLEDRSADLSVIAVQGPASRAVLTEAGVPGLARLEYFRAADVPLRGLSCMIARLGYSGELGYEVFAPTAAAADVWRLLRRAGRHAGLRLCGGVALESLRIEAGYLMTGVDFDQTVNPFEAGLGRFVNLNKGKFVGREALAEVRAVARRLTGLRAASHVVPLRGAAIRDDGGIVGHVTSACASPTLGCSLALAYTTGGAQGGRALSVDGVPDHVVPVELPFYESARGRVGPSSSASVSDGAAGRLAPER